MKAYGVSESIISRLFKINIGINNGLNVASNQGRGDVLWAKKVYFSPVFQSNKLLDEFEQMKTSKDRLKHKPRFLIASDFNTLLAYDTKTEESLDIAVNQLALHCDFFTPLIGIEKKHTYHEVQADIDAANSMAELYDQLVKDNPTHTIQEVHALNIFLTRLLFCYFVEDTAIFEEKNLFTDSIASHTRTNGEDTAQYIERLFDILDITNRLPDTPDYINKFPYVNGGLFKTKYPIPRFGTRSRRLLLSIGKLDWAEINPDIFGSMIQAVVTKKQRSVLGMHYTSVPNIMKVIEPLFLNELNEEFERCKTAKDVKGLRFLVKRLWSIKIFDPACGSGNFLIISYRELRRLEWDIFMEINKLNNSNATVLSGIQLNQFYGIEIDDFAHEVAILSLWLTEHQMNVILQSPAATLPLKESGNIVCGNATRLDWQTVCPRTESEEVYVLGNPPYLGARIQGREHKDDLAFVFKGVNNYKNLDYIACWFFLGAKYIENTISKYAFVTTNSICQGEQVGIIWPLLYDLNLHIFFAYTSFKWENNAKKNAGVSCVIIGLKNTRSKDRSKFINIKSKVVDNINPYLASGSNILVLKRNTTLSKHLSSMSFGNMPNDGGGLILSEDEKNMLERETPSSHIFIKRFMGADELIKGKRRWCLWIEDGQLDEALSIQFIKKRIDIVEKHRLKSKDSGTNKLAVRSHQFRDLNITTKSTIVIPRVSSERREYIPIDFMGPDTIISDSAQAIYDAAPWLFGILTSRMHMVWVRAVAGRLKTDYRYSSQLCYNTFPFPEINDQERGEIKVCVDKIRGARGYHGGKTLAQLYDPDKMPDNLRNAHTNLDKVIESIYRDIPFNNDEERLAHLFEMYEQMIKKR